MGGRAATTPFSRPMRFVGNIIYIVCRWGQTHQAKMRTTRPGGWLGGLGGGVRPGGGFFPPMLKISGIFKKRPRPEHWRGGPNWAGLSSGPKPPPGTRRPATKETKTAPVAPRRNSIPPPDRRLRAYRLTGRLRPRLPADMAFGWVR